MLERPAIAAWKNVYDRYGRLERSWFVPDAPGSVARQFFRRIVHGQQSKAAILKEFASFGLTPAGAELLDEAFFLQASLYPTDRPRPQGRHPDDPLDDVYAAALSMLPHGFWVESPDRSQLYRGERNAAWRTIPSIFRGNDVSRSPDRLAVATARIRAAGFDFDDEQAVAVAQHYSHELDVATWLLDMTYDPRVALFFASHGGRTGEIGVVKSVVKSEWERLSANGSNRLGELRTIDPPGVLRIERQRASFPDTSHPDLFDQYVAHSVWFRQIDGLVFEDQAVAHPVTAGRLYPKTTPWSTLCRTRLRPK